jgi:hypothetical protein
MAKMEVISLPFVFGIGSQRAGSTFVSSLLSAIPNAYVHPAKELHYFDTKYGIRNSQVLESLSKYRLAINIEAMSSYPGQTQLEELADQIVSDFKFSNDPSCQNHAYVYHFQAALTRRSDISYLCESTPEYMLLPSEALAEIKATIPNCKAVLAVRDPVKRFISAFRLLAANESYANEGDEALSNRAIEMLNNPEDGWTAQQDQFNQYNLAISKFEQAGIPVFIILTDDLQNKLLEVVNDLEDFLEIKLDAIAVNHLVGQKINEVNFDFNPSEELLIKLTERYQKPEYNMPTQMSRKSKLLKYLPDNWKTLLPS